ncbi:hypothetical protein VIM7927_02204 [Vibrio mangrovi]|uniref:Uncharacterized protein n=1 Tax=Vibrio mangrovi TaxID=474394 RepID=A0A1Y6IV96_9VIBR|nr:hypothetical protein VIM7927_02204 [Vibrio mangrovi]
MKFSVVHCLLTSILAAISQEIAAQIPLYAMI